MGLRGITGWGDKGSGCSFGGASFRCNFASNVSSLCYCRQDSQTPTASVVVKHSSPSRQRVSCSPLGLRPATQEV